MSDSPHELYDPDDMSTWSAKMRREHSLAIAQSHGHPYECGHRCILCAAEEQAERDWDEATVEAELAEAEEGTKCPTS